jgi:hypothetical protein
MGLETVVLALLVVLVLVQLVFSVMQSRRLQQLEQSVAASSAAQQELLGSAGNALLSLHGSVNALEHRLVRTAQRQQDMEIKSAGTLTYEQAAKLVQMGAAPEDLVKSCGLSQAEAKLVSLMAARGIGKAP